MIKKCKQPKTFAIQGQKRQMESEDYHFIPTKSEMGDSDKQGGIKG